MSHDGQRKAEPSPIGRQNSGSSSDVGSSSWKLSFKHKAANESGNSINQSSSHLANTPSHLGSSSSIFEPKYVQEVAPLLPKLIRSKKSDLRDKWSAIKVKRLALMETLVCKMSDTKQGIHQKKSLLGMSSSKFNMTFTGQEITDWLMAHCKFLIREEALRFAQELVDCNYLISVDALDKFDPSTSQYVVQLPALWPTRFWDPSNFDYAVYLLKRGLRNNLKDILKFYEEERLDVLHKSLASVWGDVEHKAEADNKILNNMKSQDRRLFRVQESSFWRMYRPPPNVVVKLFADDSKDLAPKTEHRTETEFGDSLVPEDALIFFEKKLEQLQQSLVQNRIKTSFACKSLLQRCKLFYPVDPVLTECENPYIMDDEWPWARTRSTPTHPEVKIWCNSLSDLFKDPLGVQFFNDFLAKEFSQENLHFFQKCKELESIQSKDDFLTKAKDIYTTFVKVGSPRELNINSNTRSAIIAIFEPKPGEGTASASTVPFSCFDAAVDHVFALMAKDSYARFCNSDVIQAYLRTEDSQRDSEASESRR
ncbi:hypothetical protein BC831DRAFT_452347 [Entophlyctis helioformis]|nr:hypothetical protein BC831DRAFT_452347 [Entophlyctis helioformis]